MNVFINIVPLWQVFAITSPHETKGCPPIIFIELLRAGLSTGFVRNKKQKSPFKLIKTSRIQIFLKPLNFL